MLNLPALVGSGKLILRCPKCDEPFEGSWLDFRCGDILCDKCCCHNGVSKWIDYIEKNCDDDQQVKLKIRKGDLVMHKGVHIQVDTTLRKGNYGSEAAHFKPGYLGGHSHAVLRVICEMHASMKVMSRYKQVIPFYKGENGCLRIYQDRNRESYWLKTENIEAELYHSAEVFFSAQSELYPFLVKLTNAILIDLDSSVKSPSTAARR